MILIPQNPLNNENPLKTDPFLSQFFKTKKDYETLEKKANQIEKNIQSQLDLKEKFPSYFAKNYEELQKADHKATEMISNDIANEFDVPQGLKEIRRKIVELNKRDGDLKNDLNNCIQLISNDEEALKKIKAELQSMKEYYNQACSAIARFETEVNEKKSKEEEEQKKIEEEKKSKVTYIF